VAANQEIKDKILTKGIKSIPKAIWVLCASYALIIITTVLALNFAHIDADKHINRYFDIILSRQEAKSNQCDLDLDNRLKKVELLAHESGTKNATNPQTKSK